MQLLAQGKDGWEPLVPRHVASQIKGRRLLGYRGGVDGDGGDDGGGAGGSGDKRRCVRGARAARFWIGGRVSQIAPAHILGSTRARRL